MIEQAIRDLLRDTAAIRNRVDKGANFPGIYASTVPDKHRGECIVVVDVTSEDAIHLGGEVGNRVTILQTTVFAENSSKAYSLAELIRLRISGFRGIAGDQDPVTIQSCLIQPGGGSDQEEPMDSSDRWTCSYTRDYAVRFVTSIPTLV